MCSKITDCCCVFADAHHACRNGRHCSRRPVEASPDSLFEGFGAKNFTNVDPKLGTPEEWLAFVADAHGRGLKVVADFNPSYFWTGVSATHAHRFSNRVNAHTTKSERERETYRERDREERGEGGKGTSYIEPARIKANVLDITYVLPFEP